MKSFDKIRKTFSITAFALAALLGGTGAAEAAQAAVPVYGAYFQAQEALAKDDLTSAKQAYEALSTALSGLEAPEAADAGRWGELTGAMRAAAQTGAGAATLEQAREAFLPLSVAAIDFAKQFGVPGGAHVLHCPMAARNKGASWLQRTEPPANPYFGAEMLGCGEMKEHLAAAGK
jgi:membrane fusion protein, copper/silver efflux system